MCNDKEEWEAVVPDIWLKGSKVFWPSVVDVGKYIRLRKTPAKSWPMFTVKKVKFESEKN